MLPPLGLSALFLLIATTASGHGHPAIRMGDSHGHPAIRRRLPEDTTKLIFLTWRGRGEGSKLGECQGDCDTDAECKGKLVCFSTKGANKVPGCSGKPLERNGVQADYCYNPAKDVKKKRPNIPKHSDTLLFVGRDVGVPLGRCMGDCRIHKDCKGELKCFEEKGDNVPGCRGKRKSNVDYCFDPKWKDNKDDKEDPDDVSNENQPQLIAETEVEEADADTLPVDILVPLPVIPTPSNAGENPTDADSSTSGVGGDDGDNQGSVGDDGDENMSEGDSSIADGVESADPGNGREEDSGESDSTGTGDVSAVVGDDGDESAAADIDSPNQEIADGMEIPAADKDLVLESDLDATGDKPIAEGVDSEDGGETSEEIDAGPDAEVPNGLEPTNGGSNGNKDLGLESEPEATGDKLIAEGVGSDGDDVSKEIDAESDPEETDDTPEGGIPSPDLDNDRNGIPEDLDEDGQSSEEQLSAGSDPSGAEDAPSTTHTPKEGGPTTLQPPPPPTTSPVVDLEEVTVPLTPFVIVLDFYSPQRRRHRRRYMLIKENIDEDAELLTIVTALVGDHFRSIYSDRYVGLNLDADFVDEVEVDGVTSAAYRFTGQVVFTDGFNLEEPTSGELDAAIQEALNEDDLLRELQESDNLILELTAGTTVLIEGNEVSVPAEAVEQEEPKEQSKQQTFSGGLSDTLRVGAIVLCSILGGTAIILFGGYLYIRRRDRKERAQYAYELDISDSDGELHTSRVQKKIIRAFPSPLRQKGTFDTHESSPSPHQYEHEFEDVENPDLSLPDLDGRSVGIESCDWSYDREARGRTVSNISAYSSSRGPDPYIFASSTSLTGDSIAEDETQASSIVAPASIITGTLTFRGEGKQYLQPREDQNGSDSNSLGANGSSTTDGDIAALGDVKLNSVLQVDEATVASKDTLNFDRIWRQLSGRKPREPTIEEHEQVIAGDQSDNTDSVIDFQALSSSEEEKTAKGRSFSFEEEASETENA